MASPFSQLVPVEHDPFATAAPGLVPVDNDPFSTATPTAPLTPMQQKMYDVPVIGPATKFMDRLTDAAANLVTGTLADKAGALGTATGKQLKGQNLADVIAGNSGSFSDQYHQALSDEEARNTEFTHEHPYAAFAAKVAAFPLAAGGTAFGSLAPEGEQILARTLLPTTLKGKVVLGAKQGALGGAEAGLGSTNDESVGQDVASTAAGAGLGAAGGALLAPVVDRAIGPLVNMFSRWRGGQAAIESQAIKRIALRMTQDQQAGGPTAQDMLDLLNEGGGKPLTIADVGNQNVLGEAGRVLRAPGPGKQYAAGFLTTRDQGAGTRLIGDVNEAVANGQSTFDATEALKQSRAAAAQPLYDQAYTANGTINSPEISAILQRPEAQTALAKSTELMKNAGLAPSELGGSNGYSLQQLDYTKRALDDVIGSLQRKGKGNEARILVGMKNELVGAIDNADTTAVRDSTGKIIQPGAYAQARSAFSGPSQSMDALAAGGNVLKQDPGATKAQFAALGPNDQEFFRLGAANALKAKIASAPPGANEAARLASSQAARDQLRPLFPDDASFEKFMTAVNNENLMFTTKAATIGNSATAGRVAEDDTKETGGGNLMGDLVETAGGLMGDQPLATVFGAGKLARRFMAGGNKPPQSPEVNAQIAKFLFNPDMAGNQSTLARILALGKPKPPMLPMPLGMLAGQGAPLVSPLAQHLLPGSLSQYIGQ